MAFIREIKRKGKSYFYLVESYRDKETNKVRQRNLKYLGTERPRGEYSGENVIYTAEDAIRRNTRKKNKREKTPEEILSQAIDRIDRGIVTLVELRLDGKLNQETLKPHILDIYTWRTSINELVKIIEGSGVVPEPL